MAILVLPKVRQAFFNGFKATAMESDKEPSYNGKLIIDPVAQADLVKQIDAAIEATAREKWPQHWERVLAKLKADRRTCYSTTEYTNKKGEVYDGFAGMHFISWRNKLDAQPPFFGPDGKPTTEAAGLIYGGGYIHAKVEFWAQEHKDYGLRINAKLLGGKYAGPGARFAGGTQVVQDASDFEGLPSEFPDDGFGDADIPE